MNEWRKCASYIQWNIIQAERKKEILSFAAKWIELEDNAK
jgi:hypothetical protein